MKNVTFEPVCYDHAAALIGERPWHVSRDEKLLLAAAERAITEYDLCRHVVGIDLYNLEPEAYGCTVDEPKGNGSPVIKNPLCTNLREIHKLKLNPQEEGRLPLILNTAEKLKSRCPGTEIHVPLSGPFTIAAHLLGLEELLWQMVNAPEEVSCVLYHLADQEILYARAARERGLGLTLFESSVTPPLLSPEMFNGTIVPAIKYIFDAAGESYDERPHLIIGGDTTAILNGILECEPAYIICPYETDQKTFLEHLKERDKPAVRVNMKPDVFSAEDIESVNREVQRTVKLAASCDAAVSIGTILPYDAKPAFVKTVDTA